MDVDVGKRGTVPLRRPSTKAYAPHVLTISEVQICELFYQIERVPAPVTKGTLNSG